MRHLGWLVLAACNEVLGLGDTSLYQKPPAACPPVGTAPRFSTAVHQGIQQACTFFTTSAATNTAMAECYVPMGGLPYPAFYGSLDGTLAPLDLPVGDPNDLRTYGPILAPEGDEAWALFSNGSVSRLASYRLQANGWAFAGYQAMPAAAPFGIFGTPSRRPNRHVLYPSGNQLYEAAQDATGAWNQVGAPYAIFTQWPTLSPDGLRFVSAVVTATTTKSAVDYADRPTIDATFGTPVELPNVPGVAEVFMTEDCGRIYFPGLANVLYEEEEP